MLTIAATVVVDKRQIPTCPSCKQKHTYSICYALTLGLNVWEINPDSSTQNNSSIVSIQN